MLGSRADPQGPVDSRKRAGTLRVPLARRSVSVPSRSARPAATRQPQTEPGGCHPLSSPDHRGRPPLRTRGQERGVNSALTVRWTPCSLGASVTWSAASAELAWVLTRGWGGTRGGFLSERGRRQRSRPLLLRLQTAHRRGGALEGLRVSTGSFRLPRVARLSLVEGSVLRQEMT